MMIDKYLTTMWVSQMKLGADSIVNAMRSDRSS